MARGVPEYREDAPVPLVESHAYGRIPREASEVELLVLAHALVEVADVARRLRTGEVARRRKVERVELVRRDGTDRFEAPPEPPPHPRAELDQQRAQEIRSQIERLDRTDEVDFYPTHSLIREQGTDPWVAGCVLDVDAATGIVF